MDGMPSFVSGVLGTVFGVISASAVAWGVWKSQIAKVRKEAAEAVIKEAEAATRKAEVVAVESKNKTTNLDYLFQQYKFIVDRVRKEHEEDRVLLVAMQAEHQSCREELAALKERIKITEEKLNITEDKLKITEAKLEELRQGG